MIEIFVTLGKPTFAEKQLNIIDPNATHFLPDASSRNATTPNLTTNTITRDDKIANTDIMSLVMKFNVLTFSCSNATSSLTRSLALLLHIGIISVVIVVM